MPTTKAELRDARDEIRSELEDLAGEIADAREEIKALRATLNGLLERRAIRLEQLRFIRAELAKTKAK